MKASWCIFFISLLFNKLRKHSFCIAAGKLIIQERLKYSPARERLPSFSEFLCSILFGPWRHSIQFLHVLPVYLTAIFPKFFLGKLPVLKLIPYTDVFHSQLVNVKERCFGKVTCFSFAAFFLLEPIAYLSPERFRCRFYCLA